MFAAAQSAWDTALALGEVSGYLYVPAWRLLVGVLPHAVLELAAAPLMRRRLAAVALAAVRRRTWESAMERLADGYRRALEQPRSASGATPGARRAA